MKAWLDIVRAGPLATIQDKGRPGMLGHGVSASGAMDRGSFEQARASLAIAGEAGLEVTSAGIGFTVGGSRIAMGCAGGSFRLEINGKSHAWPGCLALNPSERVEIRPGAWGNYGYLRFDREIDVPPLLGSRSTNCTVGLGGFEGRSLRAGDRVGLKPVASESAHHPLAVAETDAGPVRVIWGLHAELFAPSVRERFLSSSFRILPRLDRMGVRLEDSAGVFAGEQMLSLVSEAVVPGDIQILGDGVPIVLMRDHQPTGGYPRIATIASVDLNRFAQMRPGMEVTFTSVTPQHALALKRRLGRP